MSDNEEAGDESFVGPAPARPDYSDLSISDMLTRLQRAHVENLLALAESGELPNAQVLAQINRYLMDNGVVVADPLKTVEGSVNRPALPAPPKDRPALPVFKDRYDE